jgi:poly(hydroxyalkanoate) granule-associated protein
MVKKTKSSNSTAGSTPTSAGPGLLDSHLAGAVKDSAQQIWLAGMGAFAKAQEEGGKVFEALVKEGMSLQKKTQGLAEDKVAEVTGKMTAMAETVTSKAGQNWDKLESIFEARTAKALHKLGVPTAKDVAALMERVDALAAAVAQSGAQPAIRRSLKAAAPKASSVAAAQNGATPARKRAAAKKSTATASPAPAKRSPRRRAAAG